MARSRRAPGVRDLPWSTAGRRSSLVSLQLAFPPVCVFEIGIEDPLMIAVDRLQHSHLSENHRAVVLCACIRTRIANRVASLATGLAELMFFRSTSGRMGNLLIPITAPRNQIGLRRFVIWG